MKTSVYFKSTNMEKNRKNKGISLITLIITILVALILLSVILLSLKDSNPTDNANQAAFRNDFVNLQNELTSSKLNIKINDFEANEDINVSMKDDKIYDWLPSLKGSPLEGKVEICNGEVVFIIDDENSEEYKWAENLAGAEKVCKNSCAELPKVFSPEINANVESGMLSTQAVTLTFSGGVSNESTPHYYEYSLDNGLSFSKVTQGNGTSLYFDGVYIKQIVQVRTVATINEEQVRSNVSEFEVYINKTGSLAPIITSTTGYVSGTWTSDNVEITIASAEPSLNEELEYSLDGGKSWLEYIPNSTSIVFTTDGSHEVRARAIAATGQIGPESYFIVNINKELPSAPVISREDGVQSDVWSNKSHIKLLFSTKTPDEQLFIDHYEFSTDSGTTWQRVEKEDPTTIIDTEGTTTIIARSYNRMNMVGSASNGFIVKIDTVNPTAAITTSATTNSVFASVNATDENGSGVDTYIFYKDGNVVETTTKNEYTFENLTQKQSYRIGVVSVDVAGNRSKLAEQTVTVHKVPVPSISIDNENWTNLNIKATVSKDNTPGITAEYQVVNIGDEPRDDGWQTYTIPVPISKNYDIYARTTDSTNQKSESTVYYVRNIDKIDPTTTAPTVASSTNMIVVTNKQEDSPATSDYAYSGINEERTQYAIKKGDLWGEFQYTNRFTNLNHDTDYYVKTRTYDIAGNFADSEEKLIRTKKLNIGKIYFSLDSASGATYTPGQKVKGNVYIRLDDSAKNNTKYRSKEGSAQFIAPTNTDTLVVTDGTTTIIVETTDGVNTVTEEYEICLDNIAPSVSEIEVISPETGKYKEGTKVTFAVRWTENITVVSQPQLTIRFGDSEVKNATYVSASGNEMIYEYTIEHDDNGVLAIYDLLEGTVTDDVKNEGHGQKVPLSGNVITAANEFTVTLETYPKDSGKVTGSTKAIFMDNVTISATANTGYIFKNWTSSSTKLKLNNENSPTTSFKMPAENVTITANFKNIEYKIKYDPNGGTGSRFESVHQFNVPQKLAKNTYTKPGYTFAGWSLDSQATQPDFGDEQEVQNLSEKDGDVVTLYAVWQVGISEYRVEHYLENLNSTAFILDSVENYTATTDTIVSAEPKQYIGFSYDENIDKNITSGNVNGDGSLALRFYYVRNIYTLTVDPNGGTFANTTENSTITGKFETSVTIVNPKKQGYVFTGWKIDGMGSMSSNKFIFDASDATITAQWAPGKSNYKVEYYRENLNSTDYDLYETETYTATTDSTITAPLKEYVGFSYNQYIDGTKSEGVVLPDNSLLLKVYYTRNTYKLTVDPQNGSYKDVTSTVVIPGKYETIERIDNPVPAIGYKVTYNGNGGVSSKEEDYTNNLFVEWKKTGIGEFDAEKSEFKYLDGDGVLTARYKNDGVILPEATRQGYDLEGWYNGTKRVGTASEKYIPDEEVSLTAKWTARSDTPYKVLHYRENVTKDGYELYETDELQGITDTQAIATSKNYVGFTFDSSIEGTVTKGNIEPDGSLVLELYYTRNVHSLNFSITPVNSGTVEKAQDYPYGTIVSIKATPNAGYMFTKWTVTTNNTNLENNLSSETTFEMPDSDVSITAAFEGINYTIKYDPNKGTGAIMQPSTHKYSIPKKLSANTYERPGYTFIGWDRNKDAKQPEFLDEQEVLNLTTKNGDIVTLYAIWSAGKTTYTSQHYIEMLDGSYSLYLSETLTATVDSTVFAEPKEINGFEYDLGNDNTKASGIAEYGGELVLKSYYTRNSYTLTIDPNTGIYAGTNSNTVLHGKYEETIKIDTPTKRGYSFNGWLTEGKGNISGTNYTFTYSDEKITATYKANEYEVTYKYNDATSNNEDTSKKVTFDKPYGTLPSPKKEFSVQYNTNNGVVELTPENTNSVFSFSGWYTTNTFSTGTLVNETTNVTIDSDHDIYAKWLGGSITLPGATKVGYTLEAWYEDERFTKKAGTEGQSYVPSGAITLYAKWKPNTNTEYKVLHYKENVTSTGYDLADTDYYTGTTDAKVTAKQRTYDGFKFDSKKMVAWN